MVYDRYGRGDDAGRREPQDYGRDYGSGRDYTYSSARDYDAAGSLNRDRNRQQDDDRDYTRNFVPYGERSRSQEGYGHREAFGGSYGDRDTNTRDWGDRDPGRRGYGERDYGQSRSGQSRSGQSHYGQLHGGQPRGQSNYGSDDYRGSYASDGRRFENVGRYRDYEDDNRQQNHQRQQGGERFGGHPQQQRGGYSGQPQGYDYDDRGFFARAGDEVRSWFGDEDAERRREADMRYDERDYGSRHSHDRDSEYGSWRRTQIAALDRDYDEYRRENRSKFENEFSSWRTNRQTQRDSLTKVSEHMEVVGSDGSHVGTVDKVRGDRILLTKTDKDAEGRHHSIPSSWITTVADKVTLSKSADEAKKHWRDEENQSALLGYGDRTNDRSGEQKSSERTSLDRSFSGTY
ncbi:DUF2171 domain-containing protein [Sphingomonas jeddahensis]|uniref:DUF2171 domain-containing protein n=1 Tax=Sphingomonas jeddahensis TaxID=1915074 RepID=A0A1V2EW21_9SPHN|nr:DUF2171 domain-containing protein [Sphingomonas jeddahensis]ONF96882.1 hypothetical protein SPHI_10780 [Sphingomonas jeddahensis]